MKKFALSAIAISFLLAGCDDSNSSVSTPGLSIPSKVLDLSIPSDVLKLGNNYELNFNIESVKPLTNTDFSVDATVYSNELKTSGNFAQVHGITQRNYKTFSDATFGLAATATTGAGKTYQLKNFNLYYEDPSSGAVSEDLAIAKVGNDKNKVNLWGPLTEIKLDKAFFTTNSGDKFINEQRPMNLYVGVGDKIKVADKLSNGIQFVLTNPPGSYATVNNATCSSITNTVDPLKAKGILQKTCVEANGYKIPLLIEAKARENSTAKVAHVKKVLQFYLDNFPAEITKAISDNKATMAFYYDGKWSDRANGVADYMEENYRFQDLFATETTTVEPSTAKPDLTTKRDAAFEEVLHFVHDYGIMTNAIKDPKSKWAEFQKELDELTEKAIISGNYYPNGKDSTKTEADLDAESYDQEYLAYSLYAYYDANYTGYVAQESKSTTHAELLSNDPMMVVFMDKYFPTPAVFKTEFPGYPND